MEVILSLALLHLLVEELAVFILEVLGLLGTLEVLAVVAELGRFLVALRQAVKVLLAALVVLIRERHLLRLVEVALERWVLTVQVAVWGMEARVYHRLLLIQQ
tara:strand:- start:183 stop:491 length:309 start_codon:yes stop_codon:yes gene_type:complete